MKDWKTEQKCTNIYYQKQKRLKPAEQYGKKCKTKILQAEGIEKSY
jgi:hypothetical protein